MPPSLKTDEEIAQELYNKFVKKYPMIKMLGKNVLTEMIDSSREISKPFRDRIAELEKH